MQLSQQIANWIKEQVKKAGKKGIILGLSGGIDSSVCGALSKMAADSNVLGLLLPCESVSEDIECAREVAKKFNIETREIPLDGIYESITAVKPDTGQLAKANIKPRLRMTMLYYFANSMDFLVIGTGNKSEATIGYFTKYGDGGADILPLGNLLKSEVKKLARELGVPERIINRVPSAGLWQGQTDEGEMGMTYDELDKAILAIEKKKTENIDPKKLVKVKGMIRCSEHKRCGIPVFGK